jgi:hypothetical protein
MFFFEARGRGADRLRANLGVIRGGVGVGEGAVGAFFPQQRKPIVENKWNCRFKPVVGGKWGHTRRIVYIEQSKQKKGGSREAVARNEMSVIMK